MRLASYILASLLLLTGCLSHTASTHTYKLVGLTTQPATRPTTRPATQPVTQPFVTLRENELVLDPALEKYLPLWRAEVDRRFNTGPKAFIIVCHGCDVFGRWFCLPADGDGPLDVGELARVIRRIKPKTPVCIICCNPGHHTLSVKGVFYALDSVWLLPDPVCPVRAYGDSAIGSIWGFQGSW